MDEFNLPSQDDYPDLHILIKIGLYLDKSECERIFKFTFPQLESIYKLRLAHDSSTIARVNLMNTPVMMDDGDNFHNSMFPDLFGEGPSCNKIQNKCLFFPSKGSYEQLFPDGLHAALFDGTSKHNGELRIKSLDLLLYNWDEGCDLIRSITSESNVDFSLHECLKIRDLLNVSNDELELWFSWSVVIPQGHPTIPSKYGLEIRSEVVSVFGNTKFDLYEREDKTLLLLEYGTGITCIGLRSISLSLSKDVIDTGLVFGNYFCSHRTHLRGMMDRHQSNMQWKRDIYRDDNDCYYDSDSNPSQENDWMADY